MLDTAKEWAQRLLTKYGIMQPMAPEEPPMCVPAGFASASYPAFFDNVRQKDSKPVIGYPSSLVTRNDAYERRRRLEEDEAAARRRREAEADSGSNVLLTAGLLYVAQPSLFDMGRTSAPSCPEPSYTPSPSSSYDSGSSYSSSSYDSGSSYSGGGCE